MPQFYGLDVEWGIEAETGRKEVARLNLREGQTTITLTQQFIEMMQADKLEGYAAILKPLPDGAFRLGQFKLVFKEKQSNKEVPNPLWDGVDIEFALITFDLIEVDDDL